ncbi:MAG: efflux RND transporter periplasmic adaptor subunit [Bacteroidota bacterium]
MSSRKVIITSVIVLAILLAGAGISRTISSQKKPAPRVESKAQVKQVSSQKVAASSNPTQIAITGRLVADQKIDIFSEVGGVLKPESRRFREGNYFSRGAALINIENREQALNMLAQKSSLMNQITLMMPDLKTDFADNFPAWQQYLNEFDVNKTLQSLPEPKSDKERFFVSARNLHNLYYSIKSQETRLRKYIIRAPFNGRVSESMITEGTLVRVGQRLGTFFNPNSYELEAAVGLDELEYVKVGNEVKLSSDNLKQSWTGTVRRISDVIDPNTQTAQVFISVRGKGLREGMYLSADVQGRKLDEVLEIERALLVNDNQIYIVKDSVLALHTVEPVKFSGEKVLIKGVPDSTTILSEVIVGAYEGMKVRTY